MTKYQRKILENPSPKLVSQLEKELTVTHTFAKLLAQRGFTSGEEVMEFLNPEESQILFPFEFLAMGDVIDRIMEGIDREEKICVYGDYDCDGVCGTYILYHTLQTMCADVHFYLPSRFKDGYGLNMPSIEEMKARGTDLLITVDCGITNRKEIAYAKELGMEVIVTDHHECPEELPDTPYLINPKLPDEEYENKGLCGAAVAWKLAWGLLGDQALEDYIDVAALATIGDIMPLVGENRAIVSLGLAKFHQNPNLGLKALCQVAGVQVEKMDSTTMAFSLVPRINAVGRLAEAQTALELLLSESEEQALFLAQQIGMLNSQRQSMQKDIILHAEQTIEQKVDLVKDRLIFVSEEDWNVGIIGLAAAKLSGCYHRPTVVFGGRDGLLTGSARSVPGVDIYQALSQAQEYYEKFGGHSQAAGLTIKPENMELIYQKVNEYLTKHYQDEDFLGALYYDLAISPEEITLDFLEELAQLEPCGQGNEKPVFLLEHVKVKDAVLMGKEKNHLRMTIGKDNKQIKAIRFFCEDCPQSGSDMNLIGQLAINDYDQKPQITVQDFEQPKSALIPSLQECLRKGLGGQLQELMGLWRYIERELPYQSSLEEVTQEIRENGIFGTAVLLDDFAGLEDGLQLAQACNLQIVREKLPEYEVENCLVGALQETRLLSRFPAVYCLGSFHTARKLVAEHIPFHMVLTPKTIVHYQEQARELLTSRQELGQVYLAVKKISIEQFSGKADAIQRIAGLLPKLELKKIWFGLQVFTELALIEWEKSDKIKITMLDHGKKIDLHSSELIRGLEKLTELR